MAKEKKSNEAKVNEPAAAPAPVETTEPKAPAEEIKAPVEKVEPAKKAPVKMLKIGRSAIVKLEDGSVKMAVVQGIDDETDYNRVVNFGVVVDLEEVKAFLAK